MSVATVVTKNETTHFVAQMIEEDHPGRTRSVSLNGFSVNDARMLAFLVGNNHPELAVLFHDVDALNIYLLKLLLSTLQRKS